MQLDWKAAACNHTTGSWMSSAIRRLISANWLWTVCRMWTQERCSCKHTQMLLVSRRHWRQSMLLTSTWQCRDICHVSSWSSNHDKRCWYKFLDHMEYGTSINSALRTIAYHASHWDVQLLCCRLATFYSRSRKERWCKGETSGNFIAVKGVYLDCDRDSVIYLGDPCGPSCHTVSLQLKTCSISQAA